MFLAYLSLVKIVYANQGRFLQFFLWTIFFQQDNLYLEIFGETNEKNNINFSDINSLGYIFS